MRLSFTQTSAKTFLSKVFVRTLRGLSLLCLLVMATFSFANIASATQLSGYVGTDNGAYIYLSTSQSSLGTQIATSVNWFNPASFSATLTPGATYYLNIEAYNVGGPGGLIGSFALSDTNASFANGSQTLNTDTSNWVGIFNESLPTGVTTAPTSPPATWITPTYAVVSEGTNGVSPWGLVSNVSSSADWIWPSDPQSGGTTPCAYCWVDFSSTAITVNGASSGGSSASSVPAPAVFSLLAFALLGLFMRKSYKTFEY